MPNPFALRVLRTAASCAALLLAAGSAAAAAAPTDLVAGGVTIADGATYDAAKKEGRLVLYSTYDSTVMKPIVDAFQADTGLSVDVIRLTSQPMFDRVVAEYAAHKLGADYVDTTDITLTAQLADKGILRGFKVPNFGAIESVLRAGDGTWYSIIRSIMVIGVNTALVKPSDVPATWSDLLDPKFKGKIGFASIDAGGTSYGMYFFMRQRFGLDYWKKLAAQGARIVPSAAPVVTDLARGETVVGLDPISSLVAGAATGAPIKIVAPAEGVPSFGISGGITATAPHPHAAEVWMDWITSKRGCAAIGDTAAYGILRGEPTPRVAGVTLPPENGIYNIRISDYNQVRDTYTKEWHQIFGNR
jgi:iron(III) transport system substrate-binding protein